jgi:hypothetical protein
MSTTKQQPKICFVISPIGDNDSEIRKRSDKVLKHIICPSVDPLGYEVIRADKISEPGIITTQIIQYIVDSPLVIADLTDRNPNVFYELALRHAIRKPLVQLIKKGEAIPFDVAATRIIHFDIQDLDSVEQAKVDITSQVKSLESGKNEVDNPISVSVDLKMLKESGNPEQRSLADVVEAIGDLRAAISTIDKRISNPEGLIPPDIFETILHRMRKMMGPESMMFFKEWSYEVREITERVTELITSKKPNIDELLIIRNRLDKFGSRLEDFSMRRKMW